MENEFVPYNIALALKKLGFDELCLGYYINQDKFRFTKPSIDGKFIPFYNKNSEAIKYLRCFMIIGKKKDTICTAPLYSQVFRWFAEKYGMYRSIDALFNGGGFRAIIVNTEEHNIVVLDDRFDTYEEAELACLDRLISIVIERKHEKV